jgi:ribosome-associated translation inhibitor RaiA
MTSSVVDFPGVEIVVHGDMPELVNDYTRGKIIALVERLTTPVLHARIRLTHQPDPAVARPVRAEANLDVNGRLVRVQVAATTGREAIDLLVDRLRRRLVRLAHHSEVLRGKRPSTEPREWRHGAEPAHRPPYYPRPIEERQLVRHKSFTPARLSPAEAAREMDQMDYDFHLFTEKATGGDAVVYRGGSTGYRLARLASGPRWLGLSDVPMTISPHPAPQLTVSEATNRLDVAGLPFVFFADASTGRGCVLYHRYDGHYGLITPADGVDGRATKRPRPG